MSFVICVSLYVRSIRAGDVERGREREELYNEVYLLAVTRRGAALAHLVGFFMSFKTIRI